MDDLLLPSEHFSYEKGQEPGRSLLQELRADPGRASLETVLAEIAKLEQVRALLLPLDLFAALSPTVLKSYRQRMSAEGFWCKLERLGFRR